MEPINDKLMRQVLTIFFIFAFETIAIAGSTQSNSEKEGETVQGPSTLGPAAPADGPVHVKEQLANPEQFLKKDKTTSPTESKKNK